MVVFKSTTEIEQLMGAEALASFEECSELWVSDHVFKELAGYLKSYPASLRLMVNPSPLRFVGIRVVCEPLLDLCDVPYQVVRQ